MKVPKLRRQTFETAIIERYRRREVSVEEALIEMYLEGVFVRRVEDITEAPPVGARLAARVRAGHLRLHPSVHATIGHASEEDRALSNEPRSNEDERILELDGQTDRAVLHDADVLEMNILEPDRVVGVDVDDEPALVLVRVL